MGMFKRSKDPRTANLEQLASAKFGIFFAFPAGIIFYVCLSKILTNNPAYIAVLLVLIVAIFITNLRKRKKLEQELNEESPMTDNEKSFVKRHITKTLIILLIILAFSAVMSNSGKGSSKTHDSQYEEVFGKDPNEWTKEDKDYVNNLFDFINGNN